MTIVNLGQYLAIKREAMGLNISEAARKMDMTHIALTKIEKNITVPYPKTINKLMEFYRLTTEDLAPFLNTIRKDKEIKVISTKPLHRPLHKLSEQIEQCTLFIAEHMSNEGKFESNMRKTALNTLENMANELQEILLLDRYWAVE